MIGSLITRLAWGVGFAIILFLIYKAGGFNTASFEKMSHTLDTRGGNIIILVSFTLLFFGVAMGLGYHILAMIENKTLTSDNTIAIMLIQFVTGTAFGTALGALIQQLGGSSSTKTKDSGEQK